MSASDAAAAVRWRANADEWREKAKESDDALWQLECFKEVSFCERLARSFDAHA